MAKWIGAVIGVLAVLAVMYYVSLQYLDVSGPVFDEVRLNGLDSLSIEGRIAVENNGVLPVLVRKVVYDVNVGEKISTGTVQGGWVMINERQEFMLSQKVDISDTITAGINALQGDITPSVNGTVDLGLGSVKFEKKPALQ